MKRVSARLGGGLGNQLFLYSAAAYKASRQGSDLNLNISQLKKKHVSHGSSIDSFDLPGNFVYSEDNHCTLFLRKIARKYPVVQKVLRIHSCKDVFDCKVLESDSPLTYIEGIYFDFQYWDYINLELGIQLNLRKPSLWFDEMVSAAQISEPIMIHIRRGDYQDSAKTYGLLSVAYYREAIIQIFAQHGTRPIWIFSDDIGLVKQEWQNIHNLEIKYVEEPVGTDPAEILILLSKGKFLITGNSTFSLWAAKINFGRMKTIFPFPFYRSEPNLESIYPEGAILMNSVWD